MYPGSRNTPRGSEDWRWWRSPARPKARRIFSPPRTFLVNPITKPATMWGQELAVQQIAVEALGLCHSIQTSTTPHLFLSQLRPIGQYVIYTFRHPSMSFLVNREEYILLFHFQILIFENYKLTCLQSLSPASLIRSK